MHRSRFSLQPKKSPPTYTSPKKVPLKRAIKIEQKAAPESPISTPEFTTVKTREINGSTTNCDYSDDSYYSDENGDNEEDMEEEIEELEGLTHQELVQMYQKEFNTFQDNMDKLTEIINVGMTSYY